MALLGDAAHATTPHLGAGAGICIEDAAVLSELLADDSITSYEAVETAFAIYDEVRRPRGEYLMKNSRYMGDAWNGNIEEVGRDAHKLAEQFRIRHEQIAGVDVVQLCDEAKRQLRQRLGK